MEHKILRITDSRNEPILKDKVALVNGMSSEIGAVITETLLENGVHISGTYNRRKSKVASLIKKYGNQRVVDFQIDFLSDDYKEGIKRIVTETRERYEKIDILINVAGVWLVKPFLYEEKEEVEQVERINYWAPYEFIKKTIPYMINMGGVIINIASTAGVKGTGQGSTYSASKAALINLTESLAEEFANRGIRVNAISPGFTDTSALDKYFDDAMKELLIKHIPMARLCKPIDVANAVLGILMNDYMTGMNILLDGGRI